MFPHSFCFELRPDTETETNGIKRKLRNLKRIDGCSAFISFITIFVTLGVTFSCFEKGDITFVEDRRIWVNQSKIDQEMFEIDTGVPACQVKHLSTSDFAMDTGYSYIRGGVEKWTFPLFNQYLFLLWIFTVSCFFQGMRYYWNDAEQYTTNVERPSSEPPEEEHVSIFKTYIWNEESRYIPRGPDIGRWVEYAWTSPLQIVIVAVNVGIDSRETLFCIIMLQTLLIYQGYCIELFIDKIWHNKYKEQILQWINKHTPDSDQRMHIRNGTQTTFKTSTVANHPYQDIKIVFQSTRRERETETLVMLTLNFAVWGVHFAVWFKLVNSYMYSISELDTCYSRAPPAFVPWLLGVQFFCFTCFGVVQFIQWMKLKYDTEILHIFNCCWDNTYSAIPDTAMTLQDLSSKLKRERDTLWLDTTFYYSILSVTAKLALDVIYLSGSLALYSCF